MYQIKYTASVHSEPGSNSLYLAETKAWTTFAHQKNNIKQKNSILRSQLFIVQEADNVSHKNVVSSRSWIYNH